MPAETDEPETVKRHTNNDIWGRIHDQGKSIADLQMGMAKLEARVEGGFQGLSGQMHTVLNAIDRLSAPKPPTDIKGWLGLAITVLGTLGLIGLLVIKPLEHRAETAELRQWEHMQDSAKRAGYQEALRDMTRR